MSAQPTALDPASRGDRYLQEGDFAKAIQCYRQATLEEPQSFTGWKKLAMALVATRDYEEALRASQTAAKLMPNDADIRYASAYSEVQLDQLESATTELEKALELNPHHQSARSLLVYTLHQRAQRELDNDVFLAEVHLERALKMSPKDPELLATLFEVYSRTNARGKVAQWIKSLPSDVQNQSPLKEKIDQLARNADWANAIHMAQVQHAAAAPKTDPKPVNHGIQYVSCPHCRSLIAEHATICPHCTARLKTTGTFAGRDTGPDYAWQDLALNIMCFVYLGLIAVDFWQGARMEPGMLQSVIFAVAGARAVLVMMVFFRNDFAMTLMRYLLYVPLFMYAFGVFGFMLGNAIGGVISLVGLVLSGFMLYLLNWASD